MPAINYNEIDMDKTILNHFKSLYKYLKLVKKNPESRKDIPGIEKNIQTLEYILSDFPKSLYFFGKKLDFEGAGFMKKDNNELYLSSFHFLYLTQQFYKNKTRVDLSGVDYNETGILKEIKAGNFLMLESRIKGLVFPFMPLKSFAIQKFMRCPNVDIV